MGNSESVISSIGSAGLGAFELRLTESQEGGEAAASYQPGDKDALMREISLKQG